MLANTTNELLWEVLLQKETQAEKDKHYNLLVFAKAKAKDFPPLAPKPTSDRLGLWQMMMSNHLYKPRNGWLTTKISWG